MMAAIREGKLKSSLSAEKQALWAENLERAGEIKDSGAREIQRFMGVFDLQLHTLRTQQPRPELSGLVDKIRESVSMAQLYLGRPQPYGLPDAQWNSLREMTGHAEEVAARYEMAIEDMERIAQQEAEVAELEQAAGIVAPVSEAAVVGADVGVDAGVVDPALPAEPQAQVTNGTEAASRPAPGFEPTPEPEPEFPTGLVVGGLLTVTALGVGGWLLFRSKSKKKGK